MENDKLVRLSDAISAAIAGADIWDGGWNKTRDGYIKKALASIPAVDAVEVVHGEWIWDGYVYDAPWQCSECQKLNDIASNYCPYCGARMDGRREDGDGDG